MDDAHVGNGALRLLFRRLGQRLLLTTSRQRCKGRSGRSKEGERQTGKGFHGLPRLGSGLVWVRRSLDTRFSVLLRLLSLFLVVIVVGAVRVVGIERRRLRAA